MLIAYTAQWFWVSTTCSYGHHDAEVHSSVNVIVILLQNIILMGDFNAGGSYISTYELEQLRIRKNKEFQWLIKDYVDTTVKGTCYAYDRYSDMSIIITSPYHTSDVTEGRDYNLFEQL